MIHVIAFITVRSGALPAFLREFHALVPAVHAEEGCLEYGPTLSIDTGIPGQVSLSSETVVIVEKWRDVEALRAHLAAPHMESYRERVADIVEDVRLQILQPTPADLP